MELEPNNILESSPRVVSFSVIGSDKVCPIFGK